MRFVGVLAAVLLAAIALDGGPPAAGSHADLNEVTYVLPPDAIPAITEPRFSSTDWLTAEYGPRDKVLALVVDGDARAYPLRILNWHEIVDDVVGGVPVAATFCPLCGTGIAWDRRLPDGTVLTFKVSGRLYKNDLVMYDAESGPDSWWPQVLGEAISGPYHGTKLRLVSSQTLAWEDFKDLHPDAKLLARPTAPDGGYVRDYGIDPYSGYAASSDIWFRQGYVDDETGFHPKEYVFSLTVDGRTRVYPYRFLSVERVVNDELGGVRVVVTFTANSVQAFARGARTFRFDAGSGSMVGDDVGRWDLLTGEGASGSLARLPGVSGFWFAVFDFEMERAGRVDVYGVGIVGEGLTRPSSPRGNPWLLALLVAGGILIGAAAFLRSRGAARRRRLEGR